MGKWKGILPYELWNALVAMGFRGKKVWIPKLPAMNWPIEVWKELDKLGLAGTTIHIAKNYLVGDLGFKAKQLKEKGHSLRKIAEFLSTEEGKQISFMTVKRLLEFQEKI